MQIRIPYALFAALLLAPGCSGPSGGGGGSLSETSAKANAVARRLQNSLAYVEVQMLQGNAESGLQRRDAVVDGMVVSPDGKVLIPIVLQPNTVHRIRAWVGGKEYSADFVKADKRLGMSLIKVAPGAGSCDPAPWSSRQAPERGEWLVALTATGEDTDFQVFADLNFVRGRLIQEFDRLLLSGQDALQRGGGFFPGTVIADLDGNVVGIVPANDRNKALVLTDMRARLDRLLAPPVAPAPGKDAEDPDKQTPWIGVTMMAINEDYAEASGLPKEAVWIRETCHDSPAEKAGFKPADLIVGVDGKALSLKGGRALDNLFKLMSPEIGREIRLDILRGGQPKTLACRFDKAPEPKELKADDLGVQVQEVTDNIFYSTPNLYQRDGVRVTEVVRGSPASTSNAFRESLINPGELILELDGIPTPTLEAFSNALEAMRKRGNPIVLVKLRNGNTTSYQAMNLKLKQGHARKGDPS